MPKLLEYLKENDISHEDVIRLIEGKTDKPDLKTREELEDELAKAKAKSKKELEAEEEEEEEEEETEQTDVEKLTDTMKKMADEIAELKKKAITRKKSKPAKKVAEEEVPDGMTIKIQKNMFETMV